MDNLTYLYATGDRLQKVTDASSASAGFVDVNGTTNEYTYDGNGNVLKDENKGITSITYNFIGKPTQINMGTSKYTQYTYDAAGTKLKMVNYDSTANPTTITTDYVDGFVYENATLKFLGSPEGRVVKNGSSLEYEYAIADHQANTRLVFTSASPVADPKTADFEASSNSDFQNYPTGAKRSSTSIFNHTASGTYSQLLNNGYDTDSQVGVSRAYQVYPGDKLKIEAYAKYYAPTSSSGPLTQFASALLNAFNLPAPGGGETGTPSAGLTSWGSYVAGGNHPGVVEFPKAYVNIILLDKNFNFIDAAYQQIDGGEQQSGESAPNAAHDYMSREYTVKEAGYAFMYISNENPTHVEVYFDDVIMTYTPTNIIQYNDYYPFGLSASTSWTREGSKNDFLYNAGSELNKASGWYDLPYRNYDAALGRFMQVDPMSVSEQATYQYAGNNPAVFNDPLGATKNPQGYNQAMATADHARFIARVAESVGNAMYVTWASDFVGSTGGGGGRGVYRDSNGDLIIDFNQMGPSGGHWDPQNGYRDFRSDDEAFAAAARYNFLHKSWSHIEGGFEGALNRYWEMTRPPDFSIDPNSVMASADPEPPIRITNPSALIWKSTVIDELYRSVEDEVKGAVKRTKWWLEDREEGTVQVITEWAVPRIHPMLKYLEFFFPTIGTPNLEPRPIDTIATPGTPPQKKG